MRVSPSWSRFSEPGTIQLSTSWSNQTKPGRDRGGDAVRLLCDEMLRGIGRWLRAAGYDTAIVEPGAPDNELLATAHREGQVLLTCDRELARRGQPGGAVLLSTENLEDAARTLRAQLGIDWLHAPFSRCLVDNALLRLAEPAEQAKLPEQTREGAGPILVCPDCGRIYWPGSHVRRMRARLNRWRHAT
jgi:uncharacterized protein with PIN domain